MYVCMPGFQRKRDTYIHFARGAVSNSLTHIYTYIHTYTHTYTRTHSRWFDHMRDELLKVTSTHLASLDEYENRLTQANAQAALQQEESARNIQALSDRLAAVQSEADTLRHDLDTTSKQVRVLYMYVCMYVGMIWTRLLSIYVFSIYMCVCVCVCVHVCRNDLDTTTEHVCVYVCVYMYMYVYIYIYIYVYMVVVDGCMAAVQSEADTLRHDLDTTSKQVRLPERVSFDRTCMYTYIHTCTHTYIHSSHLYKTCTSLF